AAAHARLDLVVALGRRHAACSWARLTIASVRAEAGDVPAFRLARLADVLLHRGRDGLAGLAPRREREGAARAHEDPLQLDLGGLAAYLDAGWEHVPQPCADLLALLGLEVDERLGGLHGVLGVSELFEDVVERE